jgi:hypothetical protein
MISSLCLSMIFSENRFPLFRIMLSSVVPFLAFENTFDLETSRSMFGGGAGGKAGP